jgi:hypothetical protein
MAAVPVTFQGILFFSDVGVGGGPMPGGPSVSHPIAPGGPPPGYWGGVAPPHVDHTLPGSQPHPSHPIAPGGPGGTPGGGLGFWGGVAPPYVDQGLPLPPKPTEPPPDGAVKPPPPEGGWGFTPAYGWGYFPPKTEPSPKR